VKKCHFACDFSKFCKKALKSAEKRRKSLRKARKCPVPLERKQKKHHLLPRDTSKNA
jgi:hypothetical protein